MQSIHFQFKGSILLMKAKLMKTCPSSLWFSDRASPEKPTGGQDWSKTLFCQDVTAALNPLLAPWNKAQRGQLNLGPDRVIRKALTPKTLALTLSILTRESKQNRKRYCSPNLSSAQVTILPGWFCWWQYNVTQIPKAEPAPGPGSGRLYNQPGVVSGLSEADN